MSVPAFIGILSEVLPDSMPGSKASLACQNRYPHQLLSSPNSIHPQWHYALWFYIRKNFSTSVQCKPGGGMSQVSWLLKLTINGVCFIALRVLRSAAGSQSDRSLPVQCIVEEFSIWG